MIRYKLETVIKELAHKDGLEIPENFNLEIPNNMEFGDFATNIAFHNAKIKKKSPILIANEFAQFCNDSDISSQLSFTAVNGFLNISIASDFLTESLHKLDITTSPYPAQKDKTLLEYVSANPTGPLHIGHGRWAVMGSLLANLLKYHKTPISTEFYINDAGQQIINFTESVNAVKNRKSIPENGYHGAYIQELAHADEDPLKLILNSQKKVLKSIGVDFDCWFSEKSLHETTAIEEVCELLDRYQFSKTEDGALWFKSTEFGDDKDRVLIKADGNKTYFLVDIAYHLNKLNRGFDRLINIWGADHHGYVKRVKSGIQALKNNSFSEEQFIIIIGQLVSLKRGGEPVRMSKRTGEMITLEEVIDEIGSDATRYFLGEKSADTHIEFDLELAKKKSNENPVYYIQYAHARLCSILRKAEDADITLKATAPTPNTIHPSERSLILTLLTLQDHLSDAAIQLKPYKVALLANNLARIFHHFYETCPLLKADNTTQQWRLYLLIHTQKALQTLFSLLGISAPESM